MSNDANEITKHISDPTASAVLKNLASGVAGLSMGSKFGRSMELTAEQKSQVAQWVMSGASVSDVQKRLESDLSIRMTYMDVRFLIDDLDLEVQAPAPQFNDLKSKELDAQPEPGTVSVSIDKVKRPDVMISGSVTFSDGQTAQWSVNQMGQLGLKPAQKGYQPSREDIHEFQIQLQRLAEEQQGLM